MWLLTNRKGGSADKIEPAACVFVRVCGAGNSIRGENEGFVLGMLCTSGPFSHLYAHVDTQRHTHTSHLTACYKGEDTHTCNCTHSFLEDGWRGSWSPTHNWRKTLLPALHTFVLAVGGRWRAKVIQLQSTCLSTLATRPTTPYATLLHTHPVSDPSEFYQTPQLSACSTYNL